MIREILLVEHVYMSTQRPYFMQRSRSLGVKFCSFFALDIAYAHKDRLRLMAFGAVLCNVVRLAAA